MNDIPATDYIIEIDPDGILKCEYEPVDHMEHTIVDIYVHGAKANKKVKEAVVRFYGDTLQHQIEEHLGDLKAGLDAERAAEEFDTSTFFL